MGMETTEIYKSWMKGKLGEKAMLVKVILHKIVLCSFCMYWWLLLFINSFEIKNYQWLLSQVVKYYLKYYPIN